MTTVTIEEAHAKLGELTDGLAPGEELLILRDARPVAKLIARPKRRRGFGSMKGSILFMADDFDTPLEDFKDYME